MNRHDDLPRPITRSERFVSQFVRRWLDWDNIGEMPVSGDFRVYFRDNLETAMAGECSCSAVVPARSEKRRASFTFLPSSW